MRLQNKSAAELKNIVPDPKDIIAESIITALEAMPAPPEPKPLLENPYMRMRGRVAEHRAAVASLLLRESQDTDKQRLANLCLALSNGAQLGKCKAADSAPSAHLALNILKLEIERAITFIRQAPKLKDMARAQRLIELGDLAYADRIARTSCELDYFDKQLLQYHRNIRAGHHSAADHIAAALYQQDCSRAAAANIRTWFAFRSTTPLPPPNDDPKYLAKYLPALYAAGKHDAALDIASTQADLIQQNIALAQALLPQVLTKETQDRAWRKRIVDLAQLKYAPAARLSFNHYYGYGTEQTLSEVLEDYIAAGAHAYLASALIERALLQATDIQPFWQHHRKTYNLLMQINYADLCNATTDFAERVRSSDYCRLLEPTAPHAAFDPGTFREEDERNLKGAYENLDAPSAQFLKELNAQGCGAILYCTHTHLPVGATYAPAAVAAMAGHQVLSTVGHAWPQAESRHRQIISQFQTFGAPVEILNMHPASAAEDTQQLMDHLSKGGVIQLTNDALVGSGQRAFVPWLTMPFAQNIYAAQLCLSKQAQLVFAASWYDAADLLHVKFLPISPPPAQGSLHVRSIWYTQCAARRICKAVKQDKLTYSLNALSSYGGLQQRDDLLALNEWFAAAGNAHNLVANFQKARGDNSAALCLPEKEMGFHALYENALLAASLFLHCQAGKAAHHKPEQRFLDQHRVALVLPKSEALLSLSVGSYLAGSLLLICEDDLSDDKIRDRLIDFNPDLVVSTASRWSSLLGAAPKIKTLPVLIIEDSASQDALAELFYGFQPAEALPKYNADQAAFAVYTSGSDGKPKAAIIPASVLSNASGIDRCAALTLADRAVYLGRWDSISIAEIFALLRGRTTICVPDNQLTLSPAHFLTWLREQKVTFLSAPVTIWKYLSQKISTDAHFTWPSSLQKGLLWGERIFPAIVDSITAQSPHMQLYCIYGASELTYISFGTLSKTTFEHIEGSPGGQPIKGHTITPVDEMENHLISRKEGGNIRVESPNAMLGYWSDLSSHNLFQSDRKKPSVIIHDNVCQHDNGTLDILGRSDAIIKLAGRRISLIEIQDAAEALEQVTQAIAFAETRDDQTKLILAVESSTEDEESLRQSIRQTISEKIGNFALPSALWVSHKFPQLQNGKLDRTKIKDLAQTFHHTPIAEAVNTQEPAAQVECLESAAITKIWHWLSASGHHLPDDLNLDSHLPTLTSLEMIELHLLLEEAWPNHRFSLNILLDSKATWRSILSLAPQSP